MCVRGVIVGGISVATTAIRSLLICIVHPHKETDVLAKIRNRSAF